MLDFFCSVIFRSPAFYVYGIFFKQILNIRIFFVEPHIKPASDNFLSFFHVNTSFCTLFFYKPVCCKGNIPCDNKKLPYNHDAANQSAYNDIYGKYSYGCGEVMIYRNQP